MTKIPKSWTLRSLHWPRSQQFKRRGAIPRRQSGRNPVWNLNLHLSGIIHKTTPNTQSLRNCLKRKPLSPKTWCHLRHWLGTLMWFTVYDQQNWQERNKSKESKINEVFQTPQMFHKREPVIHVLTPQWSFHQVRPKICTTNQQLVA